jgi:hypothetical protein
MKRRRYRALVAATLASAAVALAVACTFPEVSFAPDDATRPGDETATPEGSTPGPASDAAILEATTRDDATARVPDGSCLPDDCDCDKDLFFRGGCDSGAKPDAQVDCDDLDPLRKPDAGLTGEPPPAGQVPAGDWNCDSRTDTAYPSGIQCAAGLGGCTGGPGFKDAPGCGLAADYFECKDLGLTKGGCQAVKIDSRVQLCK